MARHEKLDLIDSVGGCGCGLECDLELAALHGKRLHGAGDLPGKIGRRPATGLAQCGRGLLVFGLQGLGPCAQRIDIRRGIQGGKLRF